MPRRAKPTKAELLLQQEIGRLKTAAVLMRSELESKCGYAKSLEQLLSMRTGQLDELNGKIAQLRSQNQRLDAEAERLAEMVRLPPSSIAS